MATSIKMAAFNESIGFHFGTKTAEARQQKEIANSEVHQYFHVRVSKNVCIICLEFTKMTSIHQEIV